MDISIWIALGLFILGIATFSFSTISGGGGALMMIPVVNALMGTAATAPLINLGTFLGRPIRLMLFWKYINWKIVGLYVPTALLGSFLAAYFFKKVNLDWVQLLVALFLISTLFQYKFGKKEQSFKVQLWYFIPLGFLVSGIGTLTGGMGPVLNPFLINLGITKERLIATKTMNSFLTGMAQISSYSFFGLLNKELWMYGIALGLGAGLGSFIGKKYLKKSSEKQFLKWAMYVMTLVGIVMLIQLARTYFSI